MANLLLVVFINFVEIGALIPVLPFTVIDGLGHSKIVMTGFRPCICRTPLCFWRGRGTLWFWHSGHLLSVGFYSDDVKSPAQTAENG